MGEARWHSGFGMHKAARGPTKALACRAPQHIVQALQSMHARTSSSVSSAFKRCSASITPAPARARRDK